MIGTPGLTGSEWQQVLWAKYRHFRGTPKPETSTGPIILFTAGTEMETNEMLSSQRPGALHGRVAQSERQFASRTSVGCGFQSHRDHS